MTIELLLWSIPPLIVLLALLSMRRYSAFNVARTVVGVAIVFGTMAIATSVDLQPPVIVLLGAIGGTLVGQAYEAEKRHAADRRRAVGLDGDSMVPAGQG